MFWISRVSKERHPISLKGVRERLGGVGQVPRGQCKFSLNGVVDRYLDTNCICSFHMSQDSENNLRTLPLS